MSWNKSIFQAVKNANAKILAVSKYWDKAETEDLIRYAQTYHRDVVFGFGENRIESLMKKSIPVEKCHFIGALQSKKLRKIVRFCSVIHSLDRLENAEKLNRILRDEYLGKRKIGVFVQVKLDENKPTGIAPDILPHFLEKLRSYDLLDILGISGMGERKKEGEDFIKRKISEFRLLRDLRDRYLPKGKISAGTSQDYKIALQMGMDIVRIGKKLKTA